MADSSAGDLKPEDVIALYVDKRLAIKDVYKAVGNKFTNDQIYRILDEAGVIRRSQPPIIGQPVAAEILRRYQDGEDVDKIAADVGCHQDAIDKVIRRYRVRRLLPEQRSKNKNSKRPPEDSVEVPADLIVKFITQLGTRMREERLRQGRSLVWTARQIGISDGQLSGCESGLGNAPSLARLIVWAYVLGLELNLTSRWPEEYPAAGKGADDGPDGST